MEGLTGIPHTLWTTHGVPCERNASIFYAKGNFPAACCGIEHIEMVLNTHSLSLRLLGDEAESVFQETSGNSALAWHQLSNGFCSHVPAGSLSDLPCSVEINK